MALEVPKDAKVYTTRYEGFKGVDFTNDPSNVWYRRSPDAVNMMPDESGKPYKRTGWEKVITASQFANKYASDTGNTAPTEIQINKCYYFELSGYDHIVVFTSYGVFICREDDPNNGSIILVSSKTINPTTISYNANYDNLSDANKRKYTLAYESYDPDMIDSYDRAFFFEGAGKSAFYIYGGYKIWEYAYADDGKFSWQPVEPYIPRVNIAVDAKHETGESFEAINMLSDYVAESFQNNVYLNVRRDTAAHSPRTTVAGASLDVIDLVFLDAVGYPPQDNMTYVFTYTEEDHSWLLDGDMVQISTYGISLGGATPANGNTVTVEVQKQYRINLPKRVLSTTGMQVLVSQSTQFDHPLTLRASAPSTPTEQDVVLAFPQGSGNSYLLFYAPYLPLVDGEDAIKIIYPRNAVTSVTHRVPALTETPTYIEVTVGASNG